MHRESISIQALSVTHLRSESDPMIPIVEVSAPALPYRGKDRDDLGFWA